MNNRTVRLLRRYAAARNYTVKGATVKRAWKLIPKPLRHEARKAMEGDTQ